MGIRPAGSVQGLCGQLPLRHHDQLQLAVGRSCVPDLPPGLHVAQHQEGLLVAGSLWLG